MADIAYPLAVVILGGLITSTLLNLTLKPGQLDSVVTQMQLLSRFCDALWLGGGDAALHRTADRLLELGQRIRPGTRPRNDRPAKPAAAPRGKVAAAVPKVSKPSKVSKPKPAKTAAKRPSRGRS